MNFSLERLIIQHVLKALEIYGAVIVLAKELDDSGIFRRMGEAAGPKE